MARLGGVAGGAPDRTVRRLGRSYPSTLAKCPSFQHVLGSEVHANRRDAGAATECHAYGLIAEQLASLGSLAGQRVEFFFGALPIVASDGAPARVLARPIA